jgi:phage terminase large subunit-like protein
MLLMINGFDVYLRKAIEHGGVIFPEKFSAGPEEGKTDIYSLKQSQGSFHFSAQYLNDPIDDDAIEFKRNWILFYDPAELPREGDDMLFVDPAFSDKQQADFSGLVLTRVTELNVVHVMEALKLKLNPKQLIDEIFRLHTVCPTIRVTYIETVAAQIVLINLLKEEMIKRNRFFTLEEFQPNTREKKSMRIRGLIPRFASGGIKLRAGLSQLRDELLEFPRNTHDDLIDALSQGVGIWRPPSKYKARENLEGTWVDWEKKLPRAKLTRIGSMFRDMMPLRP